MKNIFSSVLLAILILLFSTSCKKWLDVQPRTKIKSDELLKTEQGYKDALIGCYTLLNSQSLYGRELTFGFADAIAGQYDTYANATYGEVARWNYTTVSSVRTQIDNMWGRMYNILANVNNILDNIDASKAVFTGKNFEIIKGEALALRAFLHFDLLRLFASTDLSAKAIPYVNTLTTQVTRSSTGNEVIAFIQKDLKDAAALLEADPIRSGKKYVYSDDIFLNNRHQRLNYYAAKAALARAYMWNGDKTNALLTAKEVIEGAEQFFPWIESSNISAVDDKNRDHTFSTENIFTLQVFDLANTANTWFVAATPDRLLARSSYYYERMFEKTGVGANDYRLLFTTRLTNGSYINYKYYQPVNYNKSFATMIPLIRRSEMYYIAAECNVGADNQKAVDYLNTVRTHRGITVPLSGSLADAAVTAEILKEYRKEFQGEGQLFHYCKRVKSTKFPDNNTTLSDKQYVLPKPNDEIEFGGN